METRDAVIKLAEGAAKQSEVIGDLIHHVAEVEAKLERIVKLNNLKDVEE